MARTVSDIPESMGNNFPPPGKYVCRCLKAEKWLSPKKSTPAAMLTLVTKDGMYQFEDPIFVTDRAISRLILVAKRLCGIPEETPLPDGDSEAAKELGRYIIGNAAGKDVMITIEEQSDPYIVPEGPEMGQTKDRKRRRVSFGGYERIVSDSPSPQDTDDDIPF